MTGQRPKRAVVTYIVSQMGEDREQKRAHDDNGMLAIEAQGFANLDDPVTKRQALWQGSRPHYAENEQRTKRRAAKDGEREIGDMCCPRSVVQPAPIGPAQGLPDLRLLLRVVKHVVDAGCRHQQLQQGKSDVFSHYLEKRACATRPPCGRKNRVALRRLVRRPI